MGGPGQPLRTSAEVWRRDPRERRHGPRMGARACGWPGSQERRSAREEGSATARESPRHDQLGIHDSFVWHLRHEEATKERSPMRRRAGSAQKASAQKGWSSPRRQRHQVTESRKPGNRTGDRAIAARIATRPRLRYEGVVAKS